MYDDFVQLYARSGTMYMPTLVVASGMRPDRSMPYRRADWFAS